MMIGFDDRWIGNHGIGRFANELAKRLPIVPLLLRGKPTDPWDCLHLSYSLYNQTHRHFFSPGYNPPLGKPCSFSFTIHDLIHLDVAEESSVLKRAYYHAIVRPALFNADVVFTVSNYSKERLLEWSGIAESRIVVVGNGVSTGFGADGERIINHTPYLLYVGNQKPHKNVERLVRAFAVSQLSRTMELWLTGNFSNSVMATICELGMSSKVKALGFVPESVLPAYYRGAIAVVMPSLNEGFGLPLIEAMACATPVLSSRATCLPEIAGDAALYFDPVNIEEMVSCLDEVQDDTTRTRLQLAGLERVKLFSWDIAAEKVNTAIQTVG
ncbi:glycosyltransferase family 4 protein [Moraxellaceae bacterium AER2_44_116]|nr:glycosyltransferase family 4 protein [Moraxellaceae bacterium]TQC98947.1 glycosyltransferase family 4 protein [Moraxellaceae bacterium AER2_44_116]